jgi:hypothetical protein
MAELRRHAEEQAALFDIGADEGSSEESTADHRSE